MKPRIEDIASFNAVRESGLSKLMSSIPRITVGMGTCGRGNGAEEVFHALHEGIEKSGLDVELASVGCFGACFQEPLVGLRIPRAPLVILHHVRPNDAGQILEAISTKVMPLISFSASSTTGITSRHRSSSGRDSRKYRCGMQFHSSRAKRRLCCAMRALSILRTLKSTSRSGDMNRSTRCSSTDVPRQ